MKQLVRFRVNQSKAPRPIQTSWNNPISRLRILFTPRLPLHRLLQLLTLQQTLFLFQKTGVVQRVLEQLIPISSFRPVYRRMVTVTEWMENEMGVVVVEMVRNWGSCGILQPRNVELNFYRPAPQLNILMPFLWIIMTSIWISPAPLRSGELFVSFNKFRWIYCSRICYL